MRAVGALRRREVGRAAVPTWLWTTLHASGVGTRAVIPAYRELPRGILLRGLLRVTLSENKTRLVRSTPRACPAHRCSQPQEPGCPPASSRPRQSHFPGSLAALRRVAASWLLVSAALAGYPVSPRLRRA